MKSSARIFLLVFSSLLFFLGCGKEELIPVNKDFSGMWFSENWDNENQTGKTIGINNQSVFTEKEYDHASIINTIHGYAKIKGAKLTVKKSSIGYKNYSVDVFPSYDADGNFMMTLEGETFYLLKVPVGLYISNLTSNSATVNWLMPGWWFYAGSDFEYKEASSSTWMSMQCNLANANLTNLLPATTYECRVRSWVDGRKSLFAPTLSFTTN